jgi:hypothetical protein
VSGGKAVSFNPGPVDRARGLGYMMLVLLAAAAITIAGALAVRWMILL